MTIVPVHHKEKLIMGNGRPSRCGIAPLGASQATEEWEGDSGERGL